MLYGAKSVQVSSQSKAINHLSSNGTTLIPAGTGLRRCLSPSVDLCKHSLDKFCKIELYNNHNNHNSFLLL